MTAPVPPTGPSGSAGGGLAAIDPNDARTFAGRVDALHHGVAEAHETLRRLGEEPLAVGSGQDNLAIAGWYRDLVVSDAAPAARRLADELDQLRRSVREAAAAWEQTDGHAAGSFRPDTGPA